MARGQRPAAQRQVFRIIIAFLSSTPHAGALLRAWRNRRSAHILYESDAPMAFRVWQNGHVSSLGHGTCGGARGGLGMIPPENPEGRYERASIRCRSTRSITDARDWWA